MVFLGRLRLETGPLHKAIEGTGFAHALLGGGVRREEYGPYLRQLLHLHTVVEAASADAVGLFPALALVYDPAHSNRTRQILSDFAALEIDGASEPGEFLLPFFAALAGAVSNRPWALAGVLYVLEGSRLGSAFVGRALARAWGVDEGPGRGLDYHLDGVADQGRRWNAFKSGLAALSLSAEQVADAVALAILTMQTFLQLHTFLSVRDAFPGTVPST